MKFNMHLAGISFDLSRIQQQKLNSWKWVIKALQGLRKSSRSWKYQLYRLSTTDPIMF